MIASESAAALIDHAISKMVIGTLTTPVACTDLLGICASDLILAKGGARLGALTPLGEKDGSFWFSTLRNGSPWLVNLIPGQQVSMISCDALAGKTLVQSIAITEADNSEVYFQAALS